MASGRVSKVKGKVLDTPTVPTIGTATAGGETASIAFTASTKGGPAFTYTAISNPGSITGTGSSSPVVVTGLTADTAYTFTVRGNNPTGSSEYSSASNSVTPFAATAYESISTIVVGSGGANEIEFTSIPNTYKHLQVRVSCLHDNPYAMELTFNGNSSNAYSIHVLDGNGSSASTVGYSANNTRSYVGYSTSVYPSPNLAIIDVLDYTSAKIKTHRSLVGGDSNGSGGVTLSSGMWNSTSVITSIKLKVYNSPFYQHSHFALYGIKDS